MRIMMMPTMMAPRSDIILLLCISLCIAYGYSLRGSCVPSPKSCLKMNLLTQSLPELTQVIGGSGRAKTFWEQLKEGQDPMDATNAALSDKVKYMLQEHLNLKTVDPRLLPLHSHMLLPTTVTTESTSSCGTRKFLQLLADGQSIESVLIPAVKYGRTTLCVSTQVGCDRGCQFCLTSKMGLIRNLTADEIISQVVRGIAITKREGMPSLTNVVFMGMGDAGRNPTAVAAAVACLTDPLRLGLAQSKVTVSTVGPSPEIFQQIADMPCTIAWSLHSADDSIRRVLVPSTRHSVVALREGLLQALSSRTSVRTRTIMIAITLIDEVNDSLEDARKVAEFVRPMLATAPKIVLDLIPYNDISVAGFNKPTRERVLGFQRLLREEGFFCSVRLTRGDEENAACGMLATKRAAKVLVQN